MFGNSKLENKVNALNDTVHVLSKNVASLTNAVDSLSATVGINNTNLRDLESEVESSTKVARNNAEKVTSTRIILSSLQRDTCRLIQDVAKLQSESFIYSGESAPHSPREFYDLIGAEADTERMKINNVISDRVLSTAFKHLHNMPKEQMFAQLRTLLHLDE